MNAGEKELYFIFSGTDTYWEQTAIYLDFSINKPHNIPLKNSPEDNKSKYYYCFDGVSISPISHTHGAITNLSFDPSKPRLVNINVNKKYTSHEKSTARLTGFGMTHNAKLAFQIVDYLVNKRKENIKKINFIGFSRGGPTSIVAINYISQKFKNSFTTDIFLIDPVPGPRNFISASAPDSEGFVNSFTIIPECVVRCTVSLALEEKLRGFEPLDVNSLKFISSKTKFMFLPFPDDHLQNCIWVSGILKDYFPNSPMYYNEIDETEKEKIHNEFFLYLQASKENIAGIKVLGEFLNNNRFKINLKNIFNNQKSFQLINENYYKSKFIKNIDRKEWLSIQNVNKKNKLLQSFLGFMNIRNVKKDLASYIKQSIFINKHHELSFLISFPSLFKHLKGIEVDIVELRNDYNIIQNYQETKMFFNFKNFNEFLDATKGLLKHKYFNISSKNKDIMPFKSTNIPLYSEIFKHLYPNRAFPITQNNIYDKDNIWNPLLSLNSILFSVLFEFLDSRKGVEFNKLNSKICEIDSECAHNTSLDERDKAILLLSHTSKILTSSEKNKLNAISSQFGIHRNQW